MIFFFCAFDVAVNKSRINQQILHDAVPPMASLYMLPSSVCFALIETN